MNELTSQQMEHMIQQEKDAILFFYTPLCGTCRLAERMLQVAYETVPEAPIFKINMLYTSERNQAWRLTSVPCLVFLSRGEPIAIHYRMESAAHLYQLLRDFQ